MPCIAVNAEGCGIPCCRDRIGDRIPTIDIRCGESCADVLIGCRVLCDRARRGSRCESGCLIDVCDTDRDGDRIRQTPIGGSDRHRIRGLRFIIQGSAGLELTGGADNTERCRIRATEGIGEGGIRIHIRRSNRTADILSRRRVLCYGTRRCTTCETRCLVDICDTDRNIDAIAAAVVIRDRH